MLDTGRLTLAMRAKKTDGSRFPFLRPAGRGAAAAAAATALALGAVGALVLSLVR